MTILDSAQIEPRWAALTGRILEGGYEVQELLEAEHNRAQFKIRVLGDRNAEATVRLFRAEANKADEQIAIWETLRSLGHRNISAPLASGRTELDDIALIYVVLRKPEEVLSTALEERALDSREAGDVLASVSTALQQLLSKGLVHGCLSPEQIVAWGDTIQLSAECARPVGAEPPQKIAEAKYLAPESVGANITPAADIWCLGATMFEVLKQKSYKEELVGEIASLPAPFEQIVQRCIAHEPQARCDVAEVLELYRGRAVAAAASATVGASATVKAPVAARVIAPKPPNLILPVSKPVRKTPPHSWIYVLAGLVLVLVVIWAARPKRVARKPTAVPTVGTPARGSAWETRTLPPEGSSPKPRPTQAPSLRAEVSVTPRTSPEEQPRTINGPVWRVVLFTYDDQANAQRMVETISKKHPDLQAEIFLPHGQDGPYLVTAGGGMTRDQAVRLRQKLLSMGMPRDTYIQNYRQ